MYVYLYSLLHTYTCMLICYQSEQAPCRTKTEKFVMFISCYIEAELSNKVPKQFGYQKVRFSHDFNFSVFIVGLPLFFSTGV